MAKGSFLGVKRGKLGDAVGYNVANSSDGVKQGWRIYQPVVSNPQTDGQIDQRIKLTAANNLYRALKPIIQRGWENHKYGDESRRAFLKRALGSAYVGPYLPKGSTLAVPIEGVPITYGSLTPVVVECGNGVAALTNVPYITGSEDSIGRLSQMYISANLAQQGDQVTYIFATLNGAGTVSYLTRSFYVDPANEEDTVEVLGFSLVSETYDDQLVSAVDISEFSGFNVTAFAALVSISRDGDNSNLRSYAEFDMTSEFRSYFYGSASQQEAAKASYRKRTSSSTNWPLDPGTGEYTPVVQSAFSNANVEFTPVGVRVVNPGQNQYLCIYDAEGNNYYIESREDASSSLIVYLTGTGATSTARPTGMTSANSVDVYSTANVAAGLRAWLIRKGVSPTVLPERS